MNNGYKKWMAPTLSFSLLVGGCTGMENSGTNKETKTELPNTIAAQDDYTCSFLVSTDEVDERHYVFKPRPEAYTM
ncbi:hypothetical protein [Sporosarcina sp. E16_8]|uniref:hypothetical protein n=1 Tax=Sporosarcina sp. E16_8 TaxID=2789295 RepID=UPI001A914967|nr:hypothetical protein [Sporosarcina sp. E16_8]MBO0589188.1 hypothetical protein [Sporosarcina sp. E16_8]